MMIQNSKPESQTPKPRKQLVERPNIQTLSLKAIVADAAFQSRIETDPAHVPVLDEMIREGHAIHPVTVFWTGERYILADGFHRYHAHLKRGLESIQAVVLHGSERDAMIHSAGANRLSIKPPSAANLKKAVMMLLADEEWRNNASLEIAKHVGISSSSTITRYRAEFSEKTGVLCASPRSTARNERSGGTPVRNANGYYAARVGGKCVSLGTNENKAKKILGSLVRDVDQKTTKIRNAAQIAVAIAARGCHVVASRQPNQREIAVRIAGDACFDTANFMNVGQLKQAIFDVMAIRKTSSGLRRAVVLGYQDIACRGGLGVIELAKPLGVEFMTPEEFIDSFAVNGKSVRPEEPILD